MNKAVKAAEITNGASKAVPNKSMFGKELNRSKLEELCKLVCNWTSIVKKNEPY